MKSRMIKLLCVAPFVFGALHACDEGQTEKNFQVLFEDESTEEFEGACRSSDIVIEDDSQLIS